MLGDIYWQVPLGSMLLLIAGIFLVLMWLSIIDANRRKANFSLAPPVGGILVSVGLILVGVPYYWAWIGLIADPGIYLVVVFPWVLWQLWNCSSYCRVRHFTTTDRNRDISISLYKNGDSSIRFDFEPLETESESNYSSCSSMGLAGSWSAEGNCIVLSGFPNRRELTLNSMEDKFIASDDCDENDDSPDTNLDGVIFKELQKKK